MPTCSNCSAALRAEWKFCIYCGTPVGAEADSEAIPAAIRPESEPRPPLNPLAIVALLLACVGGFPALIFGHIAMRQIKRTGERGIVIARVATVLGYLWLVATLVLLYSAFSG